MSPSWRDQIQVYFAPGRVDCVRFLRGIKPKETPRVTTICSQNPGLPVWESPLRQLDTLLTDANGTELSITLSNHFVRYIPLPPQTEITTPEEVLAYANFRMREIYAERVDDWVLSVSAWDPLRGAICAAITRDLLTQVQQLTARHKIKFKGVTPYLVAVFDRWHSLFDNKKLCFALIESERICIALLADGIWHVIRNQKIIHDATNELLIALDQEIIFTGEKEIIEEVCVFAPEHPALVLPEDCGWRMVPIQADNISVPAHFPLPTGKDDKVSSCIA